MTDPHLLGVSEDANPDLPVYNAAGGQVPTEYVRNVFAKELSALGFPVTADPQAATHTLQLQLDQFWIVEGNTYQAALMAQGWLIDRNSTTLWQGPIAGKSSRWGRSQEENNFLQAFGDATLDGSVKLAQTPEFRNALAAQPRRSSDRARPPRHAARLAASRPRPAGAGRPLLLRVRRGPARPAAR
ncbi:hypothetical protein [Nannocystis pusilla]|uniref:hypothetical protein n=1 Tax=Nannocystis pusilla TaxID=889268 RepID=UPI003B7BB5B8